MLQKASFHSFSWMSYIYIYISRLFYSLLYLWTPRGGCFPIMARVNEALMDIVGGSYVFWIKISFSWDKYPEMELLHSSLSLVMIFVLKSILSGINIGIPTFLFVSIFLIFTHRYIFIDFRGRRGERKREREKDRCKRGASMGCLLYVLYLGIEPTT